MPTIEDRHARLIMFKGMFESCINQHPHPEDAQSKYASGINFIDKMIRHPEIFQKIVELLDSVE